MKGRILTCCIVALTFWLTGCGAAPQYSFDSSSIIEAPKDLVWEGVMQFFTSTKIQVKTVEKDSGIIYAEQESILTRGFGKTFAGGFAECPGSGVLSVPYADHMEFNVFVVPYNNESQVTVNSTFKRTYKEVIGDDFTSKSCNPTGKFEETLLSYVENYALDKLGI